MGIKRPKNGLKTPVLPYPKRFSLLNSEHCLQNQVLTSSWVCSTNSRLFSLPGNPLIGSGEGRSLGRTGRRQDIISRLQSQVINNRVSHCSLNLSEDLWYNATLLSVYSEINLAFLSSCFQKRERKLQKVKIIQQLHIQHKRCQPLPTAVSQSCFLSS